jgi:hypothetical protein
VAHSQCVQEPPRVNDRIFLTKVEGTPDGPVIEFHASLRFGQVELNGKAESTVSIAG